MSGHSTRKKLADFSLTKKRRRSSNGEIRLELLHKRKLMKGGFWSSREMERVLRHAENELSEEEKQQVYLHIAELELTETEIRATQSGQEDYVKEIAPGWFKRYVEYGEMGESPNVFNLFLAMALASHLIGKRRFFELPGQNIYAPLSVMLSSPAGRARRGQAFSIMSDVFGHVNKRLKGEVIRDRDTPEGMIEKLKINPHAFVIAEEGQTLLSKKDYMGGMTALLCRMLDGDDKGGFEWSSKAEGKVSIKGLCANAVIGSSPKMIQGMPAEAIGGGLMSRMLLVWAWKAPRVIALPYRQTDDFGEVVEKAPKELAKELSERIRGLETHRIEYSGACGRYYKVWYDDNDKMADACTTNMQHWYARRGAQLHRLCAVMEAVDTGSWDISQETLDRGIALLEHVEAGVEHVYRGISENPREGRVQTIIDSLTRNGGRMVRSKLWANTYGKFNGGKEQFEKTLEEMQEMGLVSQRREKLNQLSNRKSHVVKLLRG